MKKEFTNLQGKVPRLFSIPDISGEDRTFYVRSGEIYQHNWAGTDAVSILNNKTGGGRIQFDHSHLESLIETPNQNTPVSRIEYKDGQFYDLKVDGKNGIKLELSQNQDENFGEASLAVSTPEPIVAKQSASVSDVKNAAKGVETNEAVVVAELVDYFSDLRSNYDASLLVTNKGNNVIGVGAVGSFQYKNGKLYGLHLSKTEKAMTIDEFKNFVRKAVSLPGSSVVLKSPYADPANAVEEGNIPQEVSEHNNERDKVLKVLGMLDREISVMRKSATVSTKSIQNTIRLLDNIDLEYLSQEQIKAYAGYKMYLAPHRSNNTVDFTQKEYLYPGEENSIPPKEILPKNKVIDYLIYQFKDLSIAGTPLITKVNDFQLKLNLEFPSISHDMVYRDQKFSFLNNGKLVSSLTIKSLKDYLFEIKNNYDKAQAEKNNFSRDPYVNSQENSASKNPIESGIYSNNGVTAAQNIQMTNSTVVGSVGNSVAGKNMNSKPTIQNQVTGAISIYKRQFISTINENLSDIEGGEYPDTHNNILIEEIQKLFKKGEGTLDQRKRFDAVNARRSTDEYKATVSGRSMEQIKQDAKRIIDDVATNPNYKPEYNPTGTVRQRREAVQNAAAQTVIQQQ